MQHADLRRIDVQQADLEGIMRSKHLSLLLGALPSLRPPTRTIRSRRLRREQDRRDRGTLVQFMFRNPHAFVHVMAPDDSGHAALGRRVGWRGALAGQGVTRESLQPGDKVVITGNPA